MYQLLKHVHMTAAAASITLFVLRGLWMITDSPWFFRRWVRIAPHVIDTILLVAAIALALSVRVMPGRDDWLTVKIVALLVYIALGFVAMKHWCTKPVRTAAWVAALAVFAYIVSVAFTKRPIPWA